MGKTAVMQKWEKKLKADLGERIATLEANTTGDAMPAPKAEPFNPHPYFRGKTHAEGMKALQAAGKRRV